MRRLLVGVLLLAGCDRREDQVQDCVKTYGSVPGGVRACLENKGWDTAEANSAELDHLKILQDGGVR